jgi:hypothetical protein
MLLRLQSKSLIGSPITEYAAQTAIKKFNRIACNGICCSDCNVISVCLSPWKRKHIHKHTHIHICTHIRIRIRIRICVSVNNAHACSHTALAKHQVRLYPVYLFAYNCLRGKVVNLPLLKNLNVTSWMLVSYDFK